MKPDVETSLELLHLLVQYIGQIQKEISDKMPVSLNLDSMNSDLCKHSQNLDAICSAASNPIISKKLTGASPESLHLLVSSIVEYLNINGQNKNIASNSGNREELSVSEYRKHMSIAVRKNICPKVHKEVTNSIAPIECVLQKENIIAPMLGEVRQGVLSNQLLAQHMT